MAGFGERNGGRIRRIAQKGGDQPQISRHTEQQRREYRRAHDDVGEGEPPSTRFSGDTAYVVVEADAGIGQADGAYEPEWMASYPTVSKTEQAASCKDGARDDRRIH